MGENDGAAKREAEREESLQPHMRMAHTDDIGERLAYYQHAPFGARRLGREHATMEGRIRVERGAHIEARVAAVVAAALGALGGEDRIRSFEEGRHRHSGRARYWYEQVRSI